MKDFEKITEVAAKRKGGKNILEQLIPKGRFYFSGTDDKGHFSGRPYSHISKILSYTSGTNYEPHKIRAEMVKFGESL